MASVEMVSEEQATGSVLEIYDEIRSQLGIDFVPNLYKAMAVMPGLLEANWARIKAIMAADGKLDGVTKEAVAVAVSAVNACDY
jgi:alkylhydroperoxidase family enzyme